jgi:hypothetical protein
MQKHPNSAITRREFALRAAFASAAVSIAPVDALTTTAAIPSSPVHQTSAAPDLPTASQAEADARLQSILGQFGSRFSDEQKTELKHLCSSTQHRLDHLRTYSLENGEGPALYLKPLVEREKNPTVSSSPGTSPEASANASSIARKP